MAQKPGFVATIKSYPPTFWVANTMEIFERMSWYGFFALSSLYITGPVETGGLGFTSEERGLIQGIVPFFLYMFPVLTGALADRYGYKKMFIIAYVGMIISYYVLGQAKTMPTFLGAFMFVAVAAAIFKPVVVGTVARVTNEKNSSMGFGVFYMMVNIGGFFGPIVAGAVRGISWRYVFIACSIWSMINLGIVILFYRDPSTEAGSTKARTFRKVMDDTVEVLGNLRFFITVFVALMALVLANFEFEWFLWWPHCTLFIVAWIVINFLYDRLLPAGSGRPVTMGGQARNPLLKRMFCSNWRFALFLLIMSGFWTSFNQIFISMPEFIRDYVDTRGMVSLSRNVFGALGKDQWIDRLAAIESTELLGCFDGMVRQARGAEAMVAPEFEKPTEREIKKAVTKARKGLRKLAKAKDSELDPSDRTIAQSMLDELDDAQRAPREAMLEVKNKAERIVGALNRKLRTNTLTIDPSLTKEDLVRLAESLPQINHPETRNPLEVIDLVDGARTILQYKVRLRPAELGELISRVPQRLDEISDEQVDVAVKTINARIKDRGKPIFEDDEVETLRATLRRLLIDNGVLVPHQEVSAACEQLSSDRRELEPKELALGIRDLAYRPSIWARMDEGRQVNPEHIVNFDALSIVFLQVMISFLMAKFHRFTTMVVGMVIAAVGIGLSAIAGGTMIGPLGGSLIVVVAGIVIFAIGEMMASPTSQEYVARIAPKDKVALYMGYYFVAVALGNLFGGILSGQLYGKLARDMQRPDLMWAAFGGIMLATAFVFLLYNWFALPKHKADTLTAGN